jgi:RNA polymerase sigma factor for flagellar operon FliA
MSHRLTEEDFARVRRIARFVKSAHPNLEYDDLVGDGVVGLLDAARRYDGELGSFTTYAGHRIHGAIIDGVRTYHGRTYRSGQFNRPKTTATDPFILCEAVTEDVDSDPADAIVGRVDAHQEAGRIMARLGPRDQEVVRLLADGHNQKQVGDLTNVHESRIAQRIKKIRERVGAAA